MKYKKQFLIFLFLAAAAALYTVIYAIPGVADALKNTEVVKYGRLVVSDETVCYFIRKEKVYLSAGGGDINYYYDEGTKVRKGTRVLEVTPRKKKDAEGEAAYKEIVERLGDSAEEQSACVSEFNGVISYFVDGYENLFTPENAENLRYGTVSRLDPHPLNLTRKHAGPKEPLYKLCDNQSWYVAAWIPKGAVSKYQTGAPVTVALPGGEVSATVESIAEDDGRWRVILRSNMYYEDFGRTRRAEGSLITEDTRGILLRNESITVRDGVIGVFAKKKNGEFQFKPVKVIATDGTCSTVEAGVFYDEKGNEVRSVDVYDEVLKNAGS